MTQEQENTEQPSSKFIERAIEEDPVASIQQIYFNGFEVALSLSDVNIMLKTNGVTHSQLFLSFNTAKTLMKVLDQHIRVLEEKTKQEIMTMDKIKEAIEK